MSGTISAEAGAAQSRKRVGLFGSLALAATLAAALLGATSAQAASSASVAPIGSASSGSYFVTAEYEARENDGLIGIDMSEEATGIVPSECQYGSPLAGTFIECPQHHEGGKIEVCYNGPAPSGVEEIVGSQQIPLTSVGAVASCPLAGFVPRPPKTGGEGSGGSGGGGGGGNPVPTAACVVPKLKGKKLAVAKKKLKAADCTLGKVKGKKSKSAKVSKQSPAPGKMLAAGAKVNVTVK